MSTSIVRVRIPTPLRTFTSGRDEVEIEAADVRELLGQLALRHQGIQTRLQDSQGEVRRFVNLFVNDADIRTRDGLSTPLRPGDVISIVPAIAGGSTARTFSNDGTAAAVNPGGQQ